MSHSLPDGWRWAKLEEFMTLIVREIDVEQDELYHQIGLRSWGKGIFHKEPVTGAELGEKSVYRIEFGDFLVSITFGWEGAVGLATQAEHGKCASMRFPTFRVNESICLAEYVLRHFQTRQGVYDIGLVSPGGAGRNRVLNKGQFLKLRILLPPLDEQRRIAEVLRDADASIASVEESIRTAQEVKRGVMRRVFTYGMGGEGTPTQHTPIGEIPVRWKMVLLNSVCERLTDGTHAGFETLPEGVNGIPFLYVSCVRDGKVFWENAGNISLETYAEISKGREPRKNLILYTTVGSYGHAALIEDDRQFSFQRHIGYVMPDTRVVEPAYLSYWLNSPLCRRYADTVVVGNAQKTVNLAVLAAYPVPLPPRDEQQEIATLLRSHDEAIRAMQVEADRLREVKRGLMQGLLSGTLRTSP